MEFEYAASLAYYLKPEMIRFLLIENLALKSLLHEKGIIDPEEYKKHQTKSADILDAKMISHLEQQNLSKGAENDRSNNF